MATLDEIQVIANKAAAKLHRKYNLPPDSYYITLAPKMLEQGINLRVERGYPVAMIYVAHLPIEGEFELFASEVKEGIKLVKSKKLYDCTSIVPISYYKSKSWRISKGEVWIPDLIPKYRIKTESYITLVMTDSETGISVEVKGEYSKACYDKARSLLSSKVMPQEEEVFDERELEKEMKQEEIKQFEEINGKYLAD